MRRALTMVLSCAVFMGAGWSAFSQSVGIGTRFSVLEIYLETAEPVAVWQFELREASGTMRVVGVESGDSDAFGEAPYYDLAAVSGGAADRIVVADYSLRPAAELPTGRSRVATVHVRLEGTADPEYVLNLMAAGGANGEPIQATIDLNTP